MQSLLARHYRTGTPVRLHWEKGRIALVRAEPSAHPEAFVAPALLDIQVNGYAGWDFAAPAGLAAVAHALAAHGVARFCPTVITGPDEVLLGTLAAIDRALSSDPELAAAVPGIHLEGPYISPLDGPRGAHPAAFVREPDPAHFARLQGAAGGRIRILTLAPERPGAPRLIAAAAAAGLVVAIGHSAAGAAEVAEAVAAGARLSTHLGNGLAAGIDRHANPLWPQLADPALRASFIADGEHLPPAPLVAMMAAKGHSRCILVSDAVRQAGLPPGSYAGVGGGEVEVLPSGRIQLAGTPYLAGSGAHLAQCVAHAARVGAATLAEALDMGALHPAQLLGLPATLLAAGAPADLLLFRPGTGGGLEILATLRAGALVHGGL